jgi:hypothetical protein
LGDLSPPNIIASHEVINPNVAHDLAILQQYWKRNDVKDFSHIIYGNTLIIWNN